MIGLSGVFSIMVVRNGSGGASDSGSCGCRVDG